jgi:DNA helicase-2/ATP-dependent DNA helicase PcrA
MARRIAWRTAVDQIPKDSIVAFTFTERAAEEMKFRIRRQMERVTPPGEDATLGQMYVGTIHGFCLKSLRELAPDAYHNYDVIDDAARLALVERGYWGILGLAALQNSLGLGRYATIETFLQAYDLLNEYGELDVALPAPSPPHSLSDEAEWCRQARLRTKVGRTDAARHVADAAARFYAYLRCRRFLDFSTSQAELLRVLRSGTALHTLREQLRHIVVDEVQDINPVQDMLIRLLVGDTGSLTAVGDHRQAIFGWRGGRVDIMATFFEELDLDSDGEIIELAENFRSTPRILDLANRWAQTIGPVKSMASPDMLHGNSRRRDDEPTHVSALAFATRDDEADWIADRVKRLVQAGTRTGAKHDAADGDRGLAYTDIAILIRSSTDARTYMRALENVGIPAVFRAGPDLFSQPEVLLFLGVLAHMAGLDQFYGSQFNARSLPNRINDVLGCSPEPVAVIRAACDVLRNDGLPLATDTADRLILAGDLVHRRLDGGQPASREELAKLKTTRLAELAAGTRTVRRVFPQSLFQLALAEADIGEWEAVPARGQAAMFHLGALSTLVKGIETPGWTDALDFRYQMIALCLWGARNARTEEAPLLVEPDAVTISTVHAAKGLEYAALFVADVCARRFPSQMARHQPTLPFDGPILKRIDPALLADNANYDDERRLMYVALTRAERYLFVTSSGTQRSQFFRTIESEMAAVGGGSGIAASQVPGRIVRLPTTYERDFRLVTSFSDLRYYLECPHDFYLRKVMGFAPTIDQAFGYGRGVHNLLRAIHTDPAAWAALADKPEELEHKLEELVTRGLFYLRYTTGAPEERMRAKALKIVSEYVRTYAPELERLTFEPEREFETLIEEEQVLISGAIDVIRLDDPPRVTLLDFKSGEPESDISSKLDEDEMRLQVSLYGLAAKHELEYEPERGLVRYLGEEDPTKRELVVALDDASLAAARQEVVQTAASIRERQFFGGPRKPPRNSELPTRCGECDFVDFCGLQDAKSYRMSANGSPGTAAGRRRRRRAPAAHGARRS